MSKFLITPRSVYGQLKCCTFAGITEPVPSPNTPDNPFGTNFTPTSLGSPFGWIIAGAMGDIGGVGFGVCCQPKEVSIQITARVDFSGEENAVVEMETDTSVGLPATLVFTLTKSGSDYTIDITKDGALVSSVTTQDPEEYTYSYTDVGTATPTACGAEIRASATIFTGSPAVPAEVTAQFFIS